MREEATIFAEALPLLKNSNVKIANKKNNKNTDIGKKNPPRVIYAWRVRKALSGVGLLLRGGIEPRAASEGEDSLHRSRHGFGIATYA